MWQCTLTSNTCCREGWMLWTSFILLSECQETGSHFSEAKLLDIIYYTNVLFNDGAKTRRPFSVWEIDDFTAYLPFETGLGKGKGWENTMLSKLRLWPQIGLWHLVSHESCKKSAIAVRLGSKVKLQGWKWDHYRKKLGTASLEAASVHNIVESL